VFQSVPLVSTASSKSAALNVPVAIIPGFLRAFAVFLN
jgi:hypothetical protein